MNPRLYRIELTRTGINRFHDLQAAHGSIAEATEQSWTRVLWAQPRKNLLIVRSDTFTPHSGLFREVHHAPYEVNTSHGDTITISTIINPVMTRNRDRKRVLVPPEETTRWLAHRLRGAVNLTHVTVDHLGPRKGKRGNMTVTIAWRAVHATATVSDPNKLHTLTQDGIGRGRAYGCGLLLIHGARS